MAERADNRGPQLHLARLARGRHSPTPSTPQSRAISAAPTLSAGPPRAVDGGARSLRRRRELVGHARRLRAGLLPEGLRRAPALARVRVPVRAAVLLERRDPR